MASLTSFGANEPLPTQRRKAITYRYGRCSVEEDSMLNVGPLMQPTLPQTVQNAVVNAEVDDWQCS